jgi:hypothetical protein
MKNSLLILALLTSTALNAIALTHWNNNDRVTFELATMNVNGETNTFSTMNAADFNQDGFDDLLIFSDSYGAEQRRFTLYLNDGESFSEVWRLNESDCVDCIDFSDPTFIPADVNNDGYPDIVTAMGHKGTAIAYINQMTPSTVCDSDINTDGTTDVTDLLFVVGNWGPCS